MADPLLDILNGANAQPGAQPAPSGDPLLQLIGGSVARSDSMPLPAMNVNPTQGQSFMGNALAGAGKFVSDTGTGVKQLIDDLAAGAQNTFKNTSFGNGVDALNARLGLQSPAAIQDAGRQAIAQTRRLDAPLMQTGGGNVGYGAAALSMLPVMPAVTGYGSAAMLGAGLGATQPALSWDERAKNTAIGTGSSLAGQALGNGLSRIIQPQTAPEAKALIDSGITLTPGQALGGGFKRAEEGLTSIPVVGDFIKAAQNRQIGQLNQAVANRALAPVGEALPAGVSGREAVDYVGSTLGAKYDALLPKMGAQLDAPFAQDLNGVVRLVQSGNMGPQEAQQFMAVLKNNVLGKFQGQDAVTGETLKAMNSDLGRLASNYARDPSFDKRQLGDAIGTVQDAVRSMIARQNPQYAPELSAIDSGYAVFKRMQRAASSVASETGVFNPAQLQSAVKAMDRSKDKGAFARGDALLQDLSDPAKQILSPKLNDSGTPYRSLLMAGAAGAAGHFVSPWAAVPALAAPGIYSPLGQRMMQGLLTARPSGAQAMAQAAGLLSMPAALAAPALAYAQQQ